MIKLMDADLTFYKGKKVFITGHTGFKGSWLCKMLLLAGAEIIGYALDFHANPSLFKLIKLDNECNTYYGDIRNYALLKKAFDESKPEIVFHLAAQPIVRESYIKPIYTYETNVIGTANILECVRNSDCVRSFLNVTTDKVYSNKEWEWGYRECDELGGYDPYSNSKSCSELVTDSYKKSYFNECETAISTARSGNVIGGGDFASDRIIPDCIRAAVNNKTIIVRNPHSIRPYQHVMEALYAYLIIAEAQYKDAKYAGCYNVGPDDKDYCQTGELVDMFNRHWGNDINWKSCRDGGPHEANYLRLDCSKIKSTFGWKPRWNLDKAVKKVVEWSKCWLKGNDMRACTDKQIKEFGIY